MQIMQKQITQQQFRQHQQLLAQLLVPTAIHHVQQFIAIKLHCSAAHL